MHLSLGGRAWAVPFLWCMCPYIIPFHVCCCCASQSSLCSVIVSWHGLPWQRNKPALPMITPTANRHLCMGEAWLGPQIALTPSVSVCLRMYVFVACLLGSWLCGSWCTCWRTLWNLQMFMQARVWLCMCVWPFHRDQWSSWILVLSRV